MKQFASTILLFLLLIILFPFRLWSQENKIELSLENLKKAEGEALRDSVLHFYDLLRHINDYSYRMNLADKAFAFTLKKDEIAHIRSLEFQAMYSSQSADSFFKEAWRIASKHNRVEEMCSVEYHRSHYYIANKQYDSAMIHILRYRDMTKEDIQDEAYRNIVNLLGDVYYHTGLFEQAKEIYHQLYLNYKKEDNWNYFRPYIMMNNLGQIALKKKDTKTAQMWFEKSLGLAQKYLHTDYRSNTLAYIKIKLAETAITNLDLQSADSLLNQVAQLPYESLQDDVRQDYLFVYLKLLDNQEQWDKALETALQLIPCDSLHLCQNRYVPEIYIYLSDIYNHLGDYKMALKYDKQYHLAIEETNEREHSARSMVLLAKKEREIDQLVLQQTQQRNAYLIIGFSLLLGLLVGILLLYYRLYQSKLKLVRKAIAKSKSTRTSVPSSQAKVETKASADNQGNQEELIQSLEMLMQTEQVYLDQELTIADLAKKLSTNRTYLSKAINSLLNTSFPNYINNYRINKAIDIIHSGYAISHTQEALAQKCGFANRQAFLRAFKKHTGVVPSFFITNYKKMYTGE